VNRTSFLPYPNNFEKIPFIILCSLYNLDMQDIHLNPLSSAFGQEKTVSLNNLSADEVTRAMQNVLSGKA
jgi:hypothetical protein